MSTISISTRNFIKTINAKIDGHGYTIRKMGAGEELDLSRELSTLTTFKSKILNIQGKIEAEKDEEKQAKLMAEFQKIMADFSVVNDRIEEAYIRLFDDHEDGSRARNLIHSLGIGNTQKVYAQIMEQADAETD